MSQATAASSVHDRAVRTFSFRSATPAANALGKDQLSPLMLAVLHSKEQVVPALLAAGADPNTTDQASVARGCPVGPSLTAHHTHAFAYRAAIKGLPRACLGGAVGGPLATC